MSVSSPPWMLVRLALDTSVHHAQADEDRLAGMDATTADAYCNFLARIYGFEAPVEHAIARQLDGDAHVRDRYKAAALRSDLLALGLSDSVIAALPQCTNINIRAIGQALGWLFVVERHTLVAGLMRRHIERTLGPDAQHATRYLSYYGDTAGARFRELGALLGAYAREHPPSSMVNAANEAFRVQRQWYLSVPSPEPAIEPHHESIKQIA